jgi:hypothetical protein
MRTREWKRARSVSEELEDKIAAVIGIEVAAQVGAPPAKSLRPALLAAAQDLAALSGVWSASSDPDVVFGWVSTGHLIELASLGCSRFGRKQLSCSALKLP